MSGARDPVPDDTPLDDEALALLEAFRAEEAIPSVVHARVWAAVQQRVEVDERRHVRRRMAWAAAGLGLAAALVLALGGVSRRALSESVASPRRPDQAVHELDRGDHVDTTRTRASRAAAVPPRADREPVEPPRPEERPEASAPSPTAKPQEARTRDLGKPSRAAAPPAIDTPATTSDALAEETRRMRQVAAALEERDFARALRLVDGWARDFPKGVLVQEREALRAIALCEAGRGAEGRAAAEAFSRGYPSAALGDRVREACSP